VPDWSRLLMPRRSLTAAATIISATPAVAAGMSDRILPTALAWQNEAWGFYDTLGMFRNAVTWKSDMLSRIRLRAAIKEPDNDEPTILTTGPAAEIVAELSQADQSLIMSSFAVYLTVPGEGYLVGETDPETSKNKWSARSADEVRYRPNADSRNNKTSPYEVVAENQPGTTNRWRRLPKETLVARVWRPHKRYYNVADSSARAALDDLRELELANRHIAAQYMSRLAMAGLILFPTEIDFPVRPEFADAPNPFVREWIETAAEAIKTPGSAAAAVPLPIRATAEYLEKIRHIDFTSKIDLKQVEKRDAAIKQVAVDLDCPPEALTGLSDANHWTGWLIEESGFKIYLAPDTELICGALTKGFLLPRLAAEGEDTENIVMWYDASEITQRPDKSANTVLAYDRGEASGEALRREAGLDEDDKPSPQELANMILFKLATQTATASAALRELTGVELAQPSLTSVPAETGAPAASGEGETQGPPEQGPPLPAENPPAAQAASAYGQAALLIDQAQIYARQMAHQAGLSHVIEIDAAGQRVHHPLDCAEHIQSCPVTQATWGDALTVRPGTPGMYACTLNDEQTPLIGARLLDGAVADMLAGSHSPISRKTRTR
jgi:hypothetical protein